MESRLVTRDQIIVGVFVRVIAPRWDRPPGTLARVTEIGYHSVGREWWFTVEWLTSLRKRSRHSLRIGEEELNTFEIVTGQSAVPLARYRHDPQPVSAQTFLPFIMADQDE